MEEKGHITELTDQVLSGDQRAVSHAISLCEGSGSDEDRYQLLSEIWPHSGNAQTVGITGPPGVGKSTLINGLIGHLRHLDQTVGIIAVDPSSLKSKGALLGDRIRMTNHAPDPGVFIRSMSNRGHLGGVAEATFLAMTVLDASGLDVVIVETVGVGQSEVEVRSLTDTVVVALQPSSGDSVQAMKSGLMEIPDIVCLNKRDLTGANTTKQQLQKTFQEEARGDKPKSVVIETQANQNIGIEMLWDAVVSHQAALDQEGLGERRRENLSRQLAAIVTASQTFDLEGVLHGKDGAALIDQLTRREIDPLSAALYLEHMMLKNK